MSTLENLPRILTDSPAIVELKREFRNLDQREEDLKRQGLPPQSEPMLAVRKRKQEITRAIFAGGNAEL